MNAGMSALRMGARLWLRHLTRWARICGLIAAGVVVAAWFLFSAVLESLALGLGVGLVVLACTGMRPPPDAKRWFQGGFGERRTARRLAVARRTGRLPGWWFAHDLRVPKSRANLDHAAVHPSGRVVLYLDTKAWHAKDAVVRVDGAKLKYGPWDQTKALDTVRWEASKLAAGVRGVPVVPVIVCDRTKVEGGIIDLDGAYVVSSDSLVQALREIDAGRRDKSRAKRVRQMVEAGFPRK